MEGIWRPLCCDSDTGGIAWPGQWSQEKRRWKSHPKHTLYPHLLFTDCSCEHSQIVAVNGFLTLNKWVLVIQTQMKFFDLNKSKLSISNLTTFSIVYFLDKLFKHHTKAFIGLMVYKNPACISPLVVWFLSNIWSFFEHFAR